MLVAWLKKTYFNSKVTEIEGKIPSIAGVATSFALTVVENKIPDVSSLVKKMDFNTKISETEGKIPSITGLATSSALVAVKNKIPGVGSLVTKTDFDAKLKAISDRVTKNKSKHLLVKNELNKLKALDLSYLKGKQYFGNENMNYLVYEVSYKYLNFYNDSNKIVS